jgi:transcriptional regulator with PAS, ATPase and Fis domain
MATSYATSAQLSLTPRLPTPPQPPMEAFGRITGQSRLIRETLSKARALARVNTSVLLQGETGSGKEVFAHALHDNGPDASAPFVAVNCGGLPRDVLASELFGYVDGAFTGARRSGMIGRIEAAQGGTLFLDEIAEMPLDLQPFLLRVLEDGEVYPVGSTRPRSVRFRLVAACNRDLRAEAHSGRFRLDLYYRVSVTSLSIPPLRDRADDIPALVERFAREAARKHGLAVKHFSDEVLAAFERYSWPGNVRELRNVVESMVVLTEGDVILLDTLPKDVVQAIPGSLDRTMTGYASGLELIEREAIRDSIRIHNGNLTRVASDLSISRSTLYLKIRRYALEPALTQIRLGTHPAVD